MFISIFIFSFVLLLSINFIFIKQNFLIDNSLAENHKISLINTPLSGGIYFFLTFIVIDFFFEFVSIYLYLFYFSFVLLGILADNKILNNPKIRFILQLIITTFFVYFSEINIENTRIYFLDDLLKINLFNNFFLIFCFMTLLNGSNFIDGLNGLLTSYFILVIVTILLMDPVLDIKLINFEYLKLYLIPMFCFVFLNLYNKNFLGDSGSYFLSMFVGLNLIYFINDNNNQIAPFFIVNLLWYPCFENLFTILRRSKLNSTIYLPDRRHLHTLIYLFLNSKLNQKFSNQTINSISSIMLIIYLLPMFLFSLNFYDSSVKLFYCLTIYILSYLYIYFTLLHYEKNKKK